MERDVQSNKKKGKASRKKRQKRKIIIVAVVVLLALIMIPIAFSWSKYDKMGKVVINDKEVKINELTPETKKAMKGYTNIALFGDRKSVV